MNPNNAIAKVIRCGAGLSFQDSGRYGFKRYGIAPSGFMDSYSANLANRLAGNLPNDCVLECLLGGMALELLQDTWISYCGGPQCDKMQSYSSSFVKSGETINITPSKSGLWGYLSIPGGWKSKPYFNSKSFHSRSRIGEEIKKGFLLYREDSLSANETNITGTRFISAKEQPQFTPCPKIRLYTTPHTHLFKEEDLTHFISATWTISNKSDRTGYRLDGRKINSPPSQPSSPNLFGSIQITPSGTPIVTLNDGPTVGGYPTIGYIHPEDLPFFVQQLPSSPVNFIWNA